MCPTRNSWRARDSCGSVFAWTTKPYSKHRAQSHSPSWNAMARIAYLFAVRARLLMLTTLSLPMALAQSDSKRLLFSRQLWTIRYIRTLGVSPRATIRFDFQADPRRDRKR